MLPKKSRLQPLELSDDFKYAMDVLEGTHKHAFVTGRAGTGKSTLLQLFRNTSHKNVVVLAPTGIAALNVKGQTVHSFFRFPPKLIQRDDIHRAHNRHLYTKVDTIVIDEVSMIRADILDGIDMFLRLNRTNDQPFGGVQMIFFGDLFQLPPVVARAEERHYFATFYQTPYFFSARALRQDIGVEMIELGKVYRQEELRFIRLLDAIRTRSIDYDELHDLNERHVPIQQGQGGYITLCSMNRIASQINKHNLRVLPTPSVRFIADIQGDFNTKLFPTDQILELKEGAQVMLIRNDPQKRFVNGSLARIVTLHEDIVKVRLLDDDKSDEIIELDKISWEMLKYEYDPSQGGKLTTRVIGTFNQYPLKLAWAITIHKSQGKTFDRVIIDLGRGAFEYGQTYVALSRCRTLEGVILNQKITYNDILVDERIVEFYDGMRRYLPGA